MNLRDALTTDSWDPGRTREPPSIRAGGDIRCQANFQCGEVTSLGCGHEGIEKAPLIARTHESAPAIGDTLASTRRKLTSVCFFESKDVRDLAIGVVERLPKNVHGSFRGREALLQHQERGPQRFARSAPDPASALVSTGSRTQRPA